MNKKRTITLVIFTMVLILFVGSAKCETRNFLYQNDVIINGLHGQHTMYFYVNKNWDVTNKSYLEIYYERSQLLLNDNSSLTVYVNNKPVKSYNILAEDTIRFNLDKKMLNYGYNSVKIVSYNRISDKPCEDDMNSGNWIKILGSSIIHLDYTYKSTEISLADFPFPLIEKGLNQPLKFDFVIPDTNDKINYELACMAASMLGSVNGEALSNISLFKYDNQANYSNNILFISNRDYLPKEIAGYFSKSELLSDDSIIKLVESKYNRSKKMMILLYGNDNSYITLLNYLLNKDMKNLRFKQLTIPSSANLHIFSSNKNNYLLSDFGLSNMKVNRLFSNDIFLSIRPPANMQYNDSVKLRLKFNYGKNLNFDKSLLTVEVNNKPVASEKLSIDNANLHLMEIDMPKITNDYGLYNLKLNFGLYTKDDYCETRVMNSVWANIMSESEIIINSSELNITEVNKYDSLFVNGYQQKAFNVYLPTNPTKEMLNTMITVCSQIGKQVKYINKINVYLGETTGEVRENGVYISELNNSTYSSNINNKLTVKYNTDNKQFMEDNIMFTEDKLIGSIQINSNDNRSNVYINAVNSDYLGLINKIIYNTDSLATLKGDTCLISKEGNIESIYHSKDLNNYLNDVDNKEDKKFEIKSLFNKLNNKKILVFVVSIILIIVIYLIYAFKQKKKRI